MTFRNSYRKVNWNDLAKPLLPLTHSVQAVGGWHYFVACPLTERGGQTAADSDSDGVYYYNLLRPSSEAKR